LRSHQVQCSASTISLVSTFRNEILEQNPELAEELLSEIEKMKNEKEKLVAEHQRMLKEKEDLEQQLLDKVKDGGEGSTVSKTSATATGVSSGAWGTGEATSSSLSMPPSASGSHQPPDDSVPSKTSATATGVSGGSWGAGEATSPPVPMSSSASGSPQLKNDSAPSKTSATATGVSGGSWGAGEATSPPVSMSSSSTGSPPPQDGSEPFKTSATATGESGDSLNAGQGTTSPVSTSALSSAPASTDDDAQFEADTECFENNAIEPSSTETATTRKSDGSSTATDFSLRGFLQEVMKEFEKDIGRITGLLLPVITPMLEAGNFAWKHAKVLFRGIKHQWEKYQSSQKEAAQQGGKEGGDESVPSQASKTSDVA